MPATRDPYANFADLYDSECDNDDIRAFYSEFRNHLLDAIRKYKVPVRVLADLACGTGNSTVPWTRRKGWTVIGVDRSRAMLREARKKSKGVHWICQDLRDLHLTEKADVATCHFDAINHILNARDLQAVFKKIARILNKGGLFQFDLNTDFWFRWLHAHEKLFRIGRNYMMASNEYDAEKRIVTFRQLWFVRQGRTYRKREVCVREAAYSRSEIRGMLRKAGLTPLKISVNRKLEGKPIRLLYLARKA
jgi:ubiquinone/menaquinone biosynthesis C-methylase UbiE